MGPASKNAGYEENEDRKAREAEASMGPASKNAGYGLTVQHVADALRASMGPASKNAGYGRPGRTSRTHRLRFNGSGVQERRLWKLLTGHANQLSRASMGPASKNAGYDHPMRTKRRTPKSFNGSGVRERRLCPGKLRDCFPQGLLQWVRRPRTPVMFRRMLRFQKVG